MNTAVHKIIRQTAMIKFEWRPYVSKSIRTELNTSKTTFIYLAISSASHIQISHDLIDFIIQIERIALQIH